MTFRNTVLAMSDTELRIEVAKAKGWKNVKYLPVSETIMGIPPDGEMIPDYVPNYPHDISAAWELVEEIKDNFEDFQLYHHFEDQPGDGWYCSFGQNNKYLVIADTAPKAITRAYLIWNEERGK